MKHVGGWWVPDVMEKGCGNHLARALELVDQMPRVRKRRVAVQAGGHVGTYPKVLAERFERVYTFEPERENFACLTRNCVQGNVYAARACLGEQRGGVALDIAKKNTGKHQVRGAGHVPVYRIDDFELDALDLLQLDVEGYEVPALRGGIVSITRHRPLIVAEENSRMAVFGRKAGDIERLLAPIGYRVVERIGEDIVLQC